MGLLVIHVLSLLLPRRFEMSIYRIAQSLMRRLYAVLDASSVA
jgi:hypothetical protein